MTEQQKEQQPIVPRVSFFHSFPSTWYCLAFWWQTFQQVELPRWLSGKKTCQCRRHVFDPWVRKIPWRKKWQPTPVLLPGEFHGQRNLEGYSPWDYKESDMTVWLTHFQRLEKYFPLMSSIAFIKIYKLSVGTRSQTNFLFCSLLDTLQIFTDLLLLELIIIAIITWDSGYMLGSL